MLAKYNIRNIKKYKESESDYWIYYDQIMDHFFFSKIGTH